MAGKRKALTKTPGTGWGGKRAGQGAPPVGRASDASDVTIMVGSIPVTKPISPKNGPVFTTIEDPAEFLRLVQQGAIDPTAAQLKAAQALLASDDKRRAAEAAAEKAKGVKAQRNEAAKDALDAGASKFARRPRLVV